MCTLQELQCSVELTLFWGSEIHLQFLFDPGFQSFLNPKFVCNCPENYVYLLAPRWILRTSSAFLDFQEMLRKPAPGLARHLEGKDESTNSCIFTFAWKHLINCSGE